MGINLPACCMDFDIDPLDLIFPERMSEQGQDFISVHKFDGSDWGISKINKISTIMPNGWIKIHHRCSALADDGKCKIYDTRPQICRDFDCATRTDCACKGKGIINA